MVYLSPSAIAEIKRLRSRADTPDSLFRLGIQAGGCSGLLYSLGFDKATHPDDQIYLCEDLQVVIDSESLSQLNGLTLDYSEDLMGGGFRFHNPNATQSCGCGNSFSV